MNADIIRLTNRHLAKLLDKLDEVNSPSIIKDAVKAHFWWYAEDTDNLISKGQENGNRKEVISNI